MPLNLSTFTAWYGMKAGELVAEEVFSELFKPTGDTALVAAEGLGKVSGRGNGHLPSVICGASTTLRFERRKRFGARSGGDEGREDGSNVT